MIDRARVSPRASWFTLLPLLFVLSSVTLQADVLLVSPSGPGDFSTIQAAADAAGPGDTILVHAGTYREDVTFTRSGTPDAPIAMRPYGDGDVAR